MDFKLFRSSKKSKFDLLCEDQVYLERNISLVKQTLQALYDEQSIFQKQMECSILRKKLIETNIDIYKTKRIIFITRLKEYTQSLFGVESSINSINNNLTKTQVLIEYNENLFKTEMSRLEQIKKSLDEYGQVIKHEFRKVT